MLSSCCEVTACTCAKLVPPHKESKTSLCTTHYGECLVQIKRATYMPKGQEGAYPKPNFIIAFTHPGHDSMRINSRHMYIFIAPTTSSLCPAMYWHDNRCIDKKKLAIVLHYSRTKPHTVWCDGIVVKHQW